MTMSELHILESKSEDNDMRAALAAGWKKADLRWERLQEEGNASFDNNDLTGAGRAWRRAWWIAILSFPADDPRRATTLANLALVDRQNGNKARAAKRFDKAMCIWEKSGLYIEGMQIARRARSSLFHLRMEAEHWDTYQENLRTRYRAFATEAGDALKALSEERPVECRLFSRWRGEKPSIYDDSRKFLSAALLIGGGA